MKEIWKDVEGYNGAYQVSNLGRVRAVPVERVWRQVKHRDGKIFDEVRIRRSRILKPVVTTSLYYVHLYTVDHQRSSIAVKRLVAEAFLPEFHSDFKTASIRHRNENHADCSVDNLYIKIEKEG